MSLYFNWKPFTVVSLAFFIGINGIYHLERTLTTRERLVPEKRIELQIATRRLELKRLRLQQLEETARAGNDLTFNGAELIPEDTLCLRQRVQCLNWEVKEAERNSEELQYHLRRINPLSYVSDIFVSRSDSDSNTTGSFGVLYDFQIQ